MSEMTKDEVNVGLFDECKRLQAKVEELTVDVIKLLDSVFQYGIENTKLQLQRDALEAKVEKLEKPVEDGEVKEILRSLRVSWDGFGKTVLKESPAADLIESQQATITELKYFAQSIIDHDWHYDSLDDAVRFARAALKESE